MSLADITEKAIPSLWALVEDVFVGVMPWGECSPRCGKICGCSVWKWLPAEAGRHGNATLKSRMQTQSSLRHIPFSNASSLLQHAFGEAIFWVLRKLFRKRSDSILGHSASIVEKRAPRSLLAQRHTVGGGPGQLTSHAGVQALTSLPLTHHHISNSECEPHTQTARPLRRPATQQRWRHHTWQGGEGCSHY